MGYIVAKFGGWANASAENVKLAADLFEKNDAHWKLSLMMKSASIRLFFNFRLCQIQPTRYWLSFFYLL